MLVLSTYLLTKLGASRKYATSSTHLLLSDVLVKFTSEHTDKEPLQSYSLGVLATLKDIPFHGFHAKDCSGMQLTVGQEPPKQSTNPYFRKTHFKCTKATLVPCFG